MKIRLVQLQSLIFSNSLHFPLRIIQGSEALTFDSDIEGSAGSSMLILHQAAILSRLLWRDFQDIQHWELASSDGACQLPILQPCESRGWVPHGVAVQSQWSAFNYCDGIIHNRFTRRICNTKREPYLVLFLLGTIWKRMSSCWLSIKLSKKKTYIWIRWVTNK